MKLTNEEIALLCSALAIATIKYKERADELMHLNPNSDAIRKYNEQVSNASAMLDLLETANSVEVS